MKGCLQYFSLCRTRLVLAYSVLTLNLLAKSYGVTIELKTSEQSDVAVGQFVSLFV